MAGELRPIRDSREAADSAVAVEASASPAVADAQPVFVATRRRRLLRFGLPLLILALAAAAFAALVKTRPENAPVAVEERAWLVRVEEISPSRHRPDLVLYGRVESPRVATLTAAVTADVNEVPAREGMSVARGEPLVGLDSRDIRLRLQQHEAEIAEIEALITSEKTRFRADQESLELETQVLELTAAEVKRIERLQRQGLGTESQRDAVRQDFQRQSMVVVKRKQDIEDHEARRASLEARLERVRAVREQELLDLERTSVQAPFDARITRVDVAPGDRVRPGETLVELYDTDSVEVRAQVPSRQLAQVKEALAKQGSLSASSEIDGETFGLRLQRLAAVSQQASGGVDALFEVESTSSPLTIGRIVVVTLVLPAVEDVVELPYEALYGLDRVYRYSEGRMEPITVERVGERRAADGSVRLLVSSPALRAGDRIITTQLPNAVSGLRVAVAE